MNVNVSVDKFVPPVLDFSIFQKWDTLSLDEKMEWVETKLKTHLLNSGEFVVQNSGMPQDIEAKAKKSLEQFFKLPIAHKNMIACKSVENGYAEPGHVLTRGDTSKEIFQASPELSEEFYKKAIMDAQKNDPEAVSQLHEIFDEVRADRNIWPDELDPQEQEMWRGYGCDPKEFRENVQGLLDARLKVSQNAVRAIALAIGLDEDYFVDRSQAAIHRMRFLNYLPNAKNLDEDVLWAEPHTDKGLITFLLPVAGLAFERTLGDDMEELDVEKANGELVMQLGLCMEVITNCQYKATRHAVIENAGSRTKDPETGEFSTRFQAPIFPQYDLNEVVAPLPQAIDAMNGVNYFPVSMLYQECLRLSSKVYRSVQIMGFVDEWEDRLEDLSARIGEDLTSKRDAFNFILDAHRTRVSELIDGINLKKEDPKYGGLLKQLETFLVEEKIIANEDDQTLTLKDKTYDI